MKLAKIGIIVGVIILPFFLYHLPCPGCSESAIPCHHELNILLAVIAAGALGGIIYSFIWKRAAGSVYPISRILVGTSFTLIFYALFYKVFLYFRCGFPDAASIFIAITALVIGFFSRQFIKGTAKIMTVLLKTKKNNDK